MIRTLAPVASAGARACAGIAALAILVVAGAPSAGATEPEGPAGAAPAHAPSFAPGRLIVQWAPGADRADRLATRADADVDLARTLGDRDFQLLATEPGQSLAGAIATLAADPDVLVAERDGFSSLQAAPNDPLFGELWGLRNLGGAVGIEDFPGPLAGADVDALGAWVRTRGTPSTVVAVIDSGHSFGHPDLAPVTWTNPGEGAVANSVDDDANGIVDDLHGADFVGANADAPSADGNPVEEDLFSGGHGMHVAGTIGAAGGNGVGITGVAQDVRLMPLRACGFSEASGDGGFCPFSAQVAAINYAGAKGARVANLSLGGTGFSQAVANALAANPDVLYVIAAGNDADDNDEIPHFPCNIRPDTDAVPAVPGAIDNVLCVAATDQADELAGFSDFGLTSVDLGAPGTETLSAYPVSLRFAETFQLNDFAAKWSATGASGGFGRTSEAPQTSFGIADSPGATPVASSVRESTLTTGVAISAGSGSCELSGMRFLSLGGGSFSYSVLSDDVAVFTSFPGNTAGSQMAPFFTVPIEDLAGTTVKVRFRYVAGAAPSAANGVWLDDVELRCYEPIGSAAATYEYLQGTSMATPHVTGAAALIFSLDPGATVTEVRDALMDSVDPVPSLTGLTATGGRLNVSSALDLFDEAAPPAPVLTGTTPASGANDNAPRVRGSAEEGSTVRLFAGAGCAGAAVATGSAAGLAGAGIPVSVPDNSTRTFSATATDTADNVSPCSATVGYTEKTPPPASGPSTQAKCRVPALKGKTLRKAKQALTGADCVLGKVTRPRGSRGRKLVVKKSTPGAGAVLAAGAEVDLKLKLAPAPKPRRRGRR